MNNSEKANKIMKRTIFFFIKFSEKMKMCKNGDRSKEMFNQSMEGLVLNDIDLIYSEWIDFFGKGFNNCDLPIMKKYRTFFFTNWPRRIKTVINAIKKSKYKL